MEIKRNINLSPSLQKSWSDKTTKNIFKLLIIFLFLIGLLLCLNYYQENSKRELVEITQQFSEQQEQLLQIEQSLTNLTPLPINYTKVLRKEELNNLVNLLQELPVKSAGISIIRFYVDQGLKLKIAGSYQHQQDFEELENFFKESGFSVNIEYLQSNNKAKADFSIAITLAAMLLFYPLIQAVHISQKIEDNAHKLNTLNMEIENKAQSLTEKLAKKSDTNNAKLTPTKVNQQLETLFYQYHIIC